MPRIPRKFVFDPTEVGVYHCINRCLRRAFCVASTAFQVVEISSVRRNSLKSRNQWLKYHLGRVTPAQQPTGEQPSNASQILRNHEFAESGKKPCFDNDS